MDSVNPFQANVLGMKIIFIKTREVEKQMRLLTPTSFFTLPPPPRRPKFFNEFKIFTIMFRQPKKYFLRNS